MKLNPPQNAAVQYIDGPLLVIAGAGSGKTRVITEKIAYLLTECAFKPDQIYAVTFTNKAAQEMKARISDRLSSKQTRGLNISTFHTLGLKIIRAEHKALGLRPNFSILDQDDAITVLKQVIDKHQINDDFEADYLLRQISLWKNDQKTPSYLISHAANALEAKFAALYKDYQNFLLTYNAVDFDDLILLPQQLLAENSEILEKWYNRVRYLLVDEYQDTNMVQYHLVKQLTFGREAFTIVGDDDQSIYAWRGAKPDNLGKLQTDFPRLKIIMLEQNYRSTTTILNSANHLIANNPHVFTKKLWSDLGSGNPIRIIETKDESDEALRVAHEIFNHQKMQQSEFRHYAILYRGNHQSRPFEKALRELNIPYQITGGGSFFSKSEIKDVMAYLRLAVNFEDDSAFLRIINVPKRGIGAETVERISNYARERGVGMCAALGELGLTQHLGPKAQQHVQAFYNIFAHFAENIEKNSSIDLVSKLLTEIDYEGWLLQNHEAAGAKRRWENVNELLEWLNTTMQRDGMSVAETVQRFALLDIIDRNDRKADLDAVQLLTLHAAKGLEFPFVYLVGMEEELLPHRNSIESDDIEEERRLAYVGITRAQKILTMTMATKRKKFGEWYACKPSRFLEELPPEYLQWQTRTHSAPVEELNAHADAHLLRLNALLGISVNEE
jgi:ATP-dependent DNA helicase Rep